MPNLTLLAPLDGWCAPLSDVPDPVFSGLMLGDGIAIDPVSGIVKAPCDGEVTTVAVGGHAVGIRSVGGIEILIHVGIDTVHLEGRGFEVMVKPGQSVRAGEELIRFDLDLVARAAKSLMTPMVITPVEGLELTSRHSAGAISAGEPLLDLSWKASVAQAAVSGVTASRTYTVQLLHGLHARPAALVAKRASTLNAEVTLAAHGKTANARSPVAMMALGVRHGDELTVTANGASPAAAIETILAGLQDALSREQTEQGAPSSTTTASTSVVTHACRGTGSADELPGVVAVPGFAIGRVARLQRPQIEVSEAGKGVAHESAEFERARTLVRGRLSRVADVGGATRREIIATHLAYLDDPVLNEGTQEKIASGKSAGFAWRSAVRTSVAALQALADDRLRERVDDLLDIEAHVLLALAGEARPMNLSLPQNAVVVADELLPSELVALDRDRLVAICLAGGGRTSHVAILAAAMDVPMLVGIGASLRTVANDTQVIVDGERGSLRISPPPDLVAEAEARVSVFRAQRVTERTAAQRECCTADGTRIEVFANLGSVADAEAAVIAGAEGCGLLRTEFLFIDRDTAPTEAEQLAVYQDVATALGGRPLVLRLMDVGGDKPLKYLPLPTEENPALGLRGIRTALRHTDLLRTQLRAALRVSPNGVVRILLPMVTDAVEVVAVRSVIDKLLAERAKAASAGTADPRIEVGAMIETPAAAMTAKNIAEVADFLSIGSNDLTQYTLAMDRGHPELASRIDALHPAVLRLIAEAAAAGQASNKIVAVCGGVAAERAAVPLLIGLGVRELSVVPAAIPALKRQIRTLNVRDCAALAARCLTLGSAAEIRAVVGGAS
jgi:multiphosphoryl transfer protein